MSDKKEPEEKQEVAVQEDWKVRESRGPGFLDPRTIEEGYKVAEYLSKSGLVPKVLQGKPRDIFIALQLTMELGLSPIQGLQNIAVINGRPTLWGDAVPALVKVHPDYEWMKMEFDDETNTATTTIKRKGEPEHSATFSEEDAKTAGLWGKPGPWTQYPKRMLTNRSRTFAVRDVFPDALKGLKTTAEAMDMEPREVDSQVVPNDPIPSGRHGVTPEAPPEEAPPPEKPPNKTPKKTRKPRAKKKDKPPNDAPETPPEPPEDPEPPSEPETGVASDDAPPDDAEPTVEAPEAYTALYDASFGEKSDIVDKCLENMGLEPIDKLDWTKLDEGELGLLRRAANQFKARTEPEDE